MRTLCLLLPALALALAASPAPAHAQIRLEGRVVDDETGLPIAGARVEIFDYTWFKLANRVTDASGGFTYPLRRAGSYRLRVARLGYQTATTPELRTGAHSYVNVEVRLKSDAVLMAPLAVVARSEAYQSPVLDGFHARLRGGLGTFFTREDVERLKPTFLSDLIATRVPGMHVATSGRGTSRQIYSNRNNGGGVRDCPVQIWVDGFLVNPRSPIGGEVLGMTLDEAVNPNDVQGIEVYRGVSTVPAEFLNPDARCGVIAVWTRRGGARTTTP